MTHDRTVLRWPGAVAVAMVVLMNTTTKCTAMIIAVTVASCMVEDDPHPTHVSPARPGAVHGPVAFDGVTHSYQITPRDAAELRSIAIDLARRAAARGYSVQDMQDAVDRHDEDAAQEILGMTAAEILDVHERIQGIIDGPSRDSDRGDQPHRPRPWMDDPHVEIRDSQCVWFPYVSCLAIAGWTSVSINLGEALLKYILSSLVCMCGFCDGGINDLICPKLSGER